MAVTVPLTTAAEAVAALAATIKLDACGETADPLIRAELDRVVSAVCEPGTVDGLDENQRRSARA